MHGAGDRLRRPGRRWQRRTQDRQWSPGRLPGSPKRSIADRVLTNQIVICSN
jgi:hypothetical protein